MRLMLAGFRKLRTRTASIVAVIVAALLVGMLEFVIGWSMSLPSASVNASNREAMAWFVTFPGAYDAIVILVFGYAGLAAMIYTAAVAGTEWSWGTLKVAVMRGESRTRYALATFGSLALALLAGVLVAFLAGVLGAIGGALAAGIPVRGFTDGDALPHLAALLVRGWIAICCISAVAYAIAMVAKSQMAGVGAVIGLYLASIVGGIASLVLPESVRRVLEYQPFSIAGDAIGITGSPSSGGAASNAAAVEPNLALAVTLVWLVASLVVAALATERAEITG
jgi:ABC-type transport system involved in multi-copper enzyme maturation permease subunit